MGKTHYKVGVLYYVILAGICTYIVIPFISPLNINITPLGIIASILGALFPDADEQNSMINSRNPIFKASNRSINSINRKIKWIIGFLFFSSLAVLVFIYMKINNNYRVELIMIVVLLLLMGFNTLKIGRKTPVLSYIYKALDKGAYRIKKFIMIIIYSAIGIWALFYGYNNGEIQGYIWGSIFIIIAVFPHRTLLHAPEGLILSTFGVRYASTSIGDSSLVVAFFIGYFSHLYLGDIFTNSGVPISSFPLIMRRLKIHDILKEYNSYKNLYKILSFRLKIPIMKTGSKFGSFIENSYVVLLVLLAIYIHYKA